MRTRQLGWTVVVAVIWTTLNVQSSRAAIFSSSGTNPNSGQAIGATVDFTVSGSNLIVTLTNTGADVLVPSDILTGVFFSLAGDPTLTRISATVSGGSTVLFGTTDPGNVVGGEWAYKSGLAGTNGGGNQGISSAGLGLVGPGDRFSGSNLQGPASPDGDQYGLTSGSDNPTTGNAAVTGSNALIQNAVVFSLSGLPSGFDPNTDITRVAFQYGTTLDDPYLVNRTTPEPTGMVVWGLFLTTGAFVARCRRRSK